MRRILRVKPGMKFDIKKGDQTYKYEVVEVYPYNAKCIRNGRWVESFSLGDFVILGMEESFPVAV